MIKLPKEDINALRKFIDINCTYLHPNHYFLTETRLALVQTIGQSEDGMVNISEEDLNTKAEVAAELLRLFSVLNPGKDS